MAYGGTLERFTGDGMMVFFNDPLTIDNPSRTAILMATDMQRTFAALRAIWNSRGYDLTMGIGIAKGVATIGAIGFEGRRDYGAIGSVTNLAARLCSECQGEQILIDESVRSEYGMDFAEKTSVVLQLKGFTNAVKAFVIQSP